MRIGFTLLAFILVLSFPYWIYLPLLFIGIIIFPLYIEAIALALLVDALYGGGGHGRILLGFPFGMITALLVLFGAPLREHLRFNA